MIDDSVSLFAQTSTSRLALLYLKLTVSID